MKEFSRRAFLKGVLTLAVSTAVPVELIEIATLRPITYPVACLSVIYLEVRFAL